MSTIICRLKPRFSNSSLSVCVREKSVWSSERIVSSPCKDIEIPKLTVDQYMFRNLDKWATKTAVVSTCYSVKDFKNLKRELDLE